MKWDAIRWHVALLALSLVVVVGGATAAGAAAPVAHLEAHGKVVWVTIDSQTGEVQSSHESVINVTAMDTCPTVDCVEPVFAGFDDRQRSNIDDGPHVSFFADQRGAFVDFNGAGYQFVDGGTPGTRPTGPAISPGIVPTVDHVYFYGTSPSYQLRAYFLTGGIHITGV